MKNSITLLSGAIFLSGCMSGAGGGLDSAPAPIQSEDLVIEDIADEQDDTPDIPDVPVSPDPVGPTPVTDPVDPTPVDPTPIDPDPVVPVAVPDPEPEPEPEPVDITEISMLILDSSGDVFISTKSGVFERNEPIPVAGPGEVTFQEITSGEYTKMTTSIEYDDLFGFINIAGITMDPMDMPTSGVAGFSGDLFGGFFYNDEGFGISGGTALMVIDFTDGDVDMTMRDLDIRSVLDGSTTENPIDRITINDMVLDGTGFSGGVISTSLDGMSVDIVGGNATSITGGQIFGENVDEVGGMFHTRGDDGLVSGVFTLN